MQPNDTMGFALDMARHDQASQDNPNARGVTDAAKSGGADRGRQAARNLCDMYGVKPGDVTVQAKLFFRI